jgi:ribosomal protein S27AE
MSTAAEDEQRRPQPAFPCPECGRPTLRAAAGEIVRWHCGVCDFRVTERGGEA